MQNPYCFESNLFEQQTGARFHRHVYKIGTINAFPERHNYYEEINSTKKAPNHYNKSLLLLPFLTETFVPDDSNLFGSHTNLCRSSPHWGHYQTLYYWLVNKKWFVSSKDKKNWLEMCIPETDNVLLPNTAKGASFGEPDIAYSFKQVVLQNCFLEQQ